MPNFDWFNDAIQKITSLPGGLLAVTAGEVPGASVIDKFGENPDVDTAAAEDVSEIGGTYTFSTVSDIDKISSSDVLDVDQIIRVQGICADTDEDECFGYAKTNGRNKVDIYETEAEAIAGSGTTLSFWRIYRMENNSDAGLDLAGMVYCYVDSAITDGVPDDATKIRAMINNGNNQTLMAIYTIPPKKVGFLYGGEIGASRSVTAAEIRAGYYSRRYGKLFKIKKRVNVSNSGTSIYKETRSFPDPIPSLTDIKLRVEMVSANNVGVFGTFQILLIDEGKFSEEYLASIGQPGH